MLPNEPMKVSFRSEESGFSMKGPILVDVEMEAVPMRRIGGGGFRDWFVSAVARLVVPDDFPPDVPVPFKSAAGLISLDGDRLSVKHDSGVRSERDFLSAMRVIGDDIGRFGRWSHPSDVIGESKKVAAKEGK